MAVAPSQIDFQQLLHLLRDGRPDAARELFDRYGDAVRRVVRRRLDRRLRRQLDSADLAQSVWASFFQLTPERYTFACPEDLVAFLSQVAYHKAVQAFRRRLQAARRDATREQPIEGADGRPPALLGRGPTPSQLAMAADTWERLLFGLPPRDRRILEMLRDGYTHREIAEQLGMHPKVVQRLLQKLARRLDPS